MAALKDDQIRSVQKSYFNILALFLGGDVIESRFLRCLLKWGFQLRLTTEDLKNAVQSFLTEGPGKATYEGR